MVTELIKDRAFATEAGTQRFARRHGRDRPADAYRAMYRLQFSALGLGTYLGPADAATDVRYEAAVEAAVRHGINVFDTASNYRCQRSERALGRALGRLFERGEVYRSELIVASKVGFVPFDGAPPPDPTGWMQAATVGRGLASAGELAAGCHCMAPDFVRATLQQSLANLGLETIDVYFLHNPETQLQVVDRATFRDRLRRAFEALEGEADAGRLRVYGLATWSGLRAGPSERDHVSLEDAVRVAEEVAGQRHRMRAIQFPLSLDMPEAVACANQRVNGAACSVLDAAAQLGLVAFGSSPLHAGRLARRTPAHVPSLPRPAPSDGAGLPETATAAETAVTYARSVPGLTCALVGMADAGHVGANARILAGLPASEQWVQAATKPPAAGCCT